MTSNTKLYVSVGAAVFAGNVIYAQLFDSNSDRITTVEDAVVHIAEDVQEIYYDEEAETFK